MTNREVLNAAADLIESKGWCQRHFAVDKSGLEVYVTSPDACLFCARGAIMAVCIHDAELSATAQCFASAHIRDRGSVGLTNFNDASGRTAAEVIEKLREVAAMPEAA